MYKPPYDIYITPHPKHPERLYLARQVWRLPQPVYEAFKMLGPRDGDETRGRVFHKTQLVLRLKDLYQRGILVKVMAAPGNKQEMRHDQEMASLQERQAHKSGLRLAGGEEEEMAILALYKAVGGGTSYAPERRSSPLKVGILRLLMGYEVCQCLSTAQWQQVRKIARRLTKSSSQEGR